MEVPICICFSRQNLQLWFTQSFYLFVHFASLVGTCPDFTSGDPREPSSLLGLVGWEDSAQAGIMHLESGRVRNEKEHNVLQSEIMHFEI